eukprot:TRINITY_DN5943_c2_g3_i1.p1 TRINITY_DN5943_c2_g3~~TRINITY_DN5943_c2_g3_i1.p1  ORF type:complete len:144 (-),score=24.71 TRINITY_DN5943_c2_g3_i1:323-754(-)
MAAPSFFLTVYIACILAFVAVSSGADPLEVNGVGGDIPIDVIAEEGSIGSVRGTRKLKGGSGKGDCSDDCEKPPGVFGDNEKKTKGDGTMPVWGFALIGVAVVFCVFPMCCLIAHSTITGQTEYNSPCGKFSIKSGSGDSGER